MNLDHFHKLMEQEPLPAQQVAEWQLFLQLCDMYLGKVKNPIVVEIGIWRGSQRKFWEELLDAEYIGIDSSNDRATPDIHGDSRRRKTMLRLKERLSGRSINVLFVDASHRYENVKRDFELYSPLCSDIIAIHDIERGRYQDIVTRKAWKFWDEMKLKAHKETEKNGEFLFLSIHKYRDIRDEAQMGIGVMVKQ
ncbi:MAG TPA: class I SAM-dependent methyltransferase [bacterium]|nr:class I SAM-dependent methyltransferase [bacterium]